MFSSRNKKNICNICNYDRISVAMVTFLFSLQWRKELQQQLEEEEVERQKALKERQKEEEEFQRQMAIKRAQKFNKNQNKAKLNVE